MSIRVRRITRSNDHLVAEVSAVSSARIGAAPVATISLRIVPDAVPGEPERKTRQRAKDLALRFLDVA